VDFNKVQIIPNGIDPTLFKPFGDIYPLKTQKKFKFLYVGGTIYRKGFDILLKAYLASFKNDDEVCLVVKDMGTNTFYKGQTLEEQIKQVKNVPHTPEIEYITDELTDEQMASLYRACDVFVSTYRGEGFSLPTLEAMASGLSVIVTRGGSTDDFTTEESA
jgi:glycosyltransferase involved in cell wall biosynthesis